MIGTLSRFVAPALVPRSPRPAYTFPGYWLVTKGTWYVQVHQIDSTGNGGLRYSPVEKIHIT